MSFELEITLSQYSYRESSSDVGHVSFNIEIDSHEANEINNGDILIFGDYNLVVIGKYHEMMKPSSGVVFKTNSLKFEAQIGIIDFYLCLEYFKMRFDLLKFSASQPQPHRFYGLYRIYRQLVAEDEDAEIVVIADEPRIDGLRKFCNMFGAINFDKSELLSRAVVEGKIDLLSYFYDLEQCFPSSIVLGDVELYEESFRAN